MEWKEYYLDAILVPSGVLATVFYHAWLWRKVKRRPHETDIGLGTAARGKWVRAIMNNVSDVAWKQQHCMLAVQTVRNCVMGSTLMATTSVLLSSGLAAVLGSTYSIERPIEGSVYGAHGGLVLAVKYGALLVLFLFAFLSYSLSIGFMNQANFLMNIPEDDNVVDGDDDDVVMVGRAEYASGLLERGFGLQVVGNRLFYAALPLVLWIFGPVPVFLCSVVMVYVLYKMDIVTDVHVRASAAKAGGSEGRQESSVDVV